MQSEIIFILMQMCELSAPLPGMLLMIWHVHNVHEIMFISL